MLPPAFDEYLCLFEGVEDLSVQEFVSERSVEALACLAKSSLHALDMHGRFGADHLNAMTCIDYAVN